MQKYVFIGIINVYIYYPKILMPRKSHLSITGSSTIYEDPLILWYPPNANIMSQLLWYQSDRFFDNIIDIGYWRINPN